MIKHIKNYVKKIFHLKVSSLITIFIFLISTLLIVYLDKSISNIHLLVSSFGIWAPIISILLYIVFSVTPIPTDSLTLINGVIFGPLLGILISFMGNNFAAIMEYFLGMTIGDISKFEKHKDSLPFGIGKLPADNFYFLFFGRFIPQIGGKVVSLVAGINKVSLFKYIWTAALSNLVGAIIFVLFGSTLINIL